jgi:hypothetical protein
MILIAYLVARCDGDAGPGDGYVDYGTTTQTDPYFPLDGGQHHQHHEHQHVTTSEHGHGDGD